MKISFTCYGHPEPQGSTRAFVPKGWTRPVITSDNPKVKPWRQQISGVAMDAFAAARGGLVEPFAKELPVCVQLYFFIEKPASVAKKRTQPTVKPDVDKLVRSVLDALTGVAFVDDSQVCAVFATKAYGIPERVEVVVETEKVYEQAHFSGLFGGPSGD
jgi:Holliday junction resolvase RusA-like endonuclease